MSSFNVTYKMSSASTRSDSKNNVKFNAAPNSVLKPLKAVIHGPPASGKTTIAKRICRRYGAHYVTVRTMIEETLDELRENIALAKTQLSTQAERVKPKEELEEEVEEEEEEDVGNEVAQMEIEQYEEQIRDINALLSQSSSGKLPDDYVVRLMRTFLAKERCQRHGYVLDGFPKTIQQAKELFGQAAEAPKSLGEGQRGAHEPQEAPGEGATVVNMLGNASVNIMPDFVISLEADDMFLCGRVMKLPESEVQGTKYDEANLIRRLMKFRAENSPNDTVLNFFDQAEIHPIILDITDEGSQDLECILSYLYDIFGAPIPGVGLTDEEEEALRQMETEERKLKHEAYLLEKQLAEDAAKKEHEDKMEKWAETLEKLQKEEEKIMAAETEPLRFYLMKHVFPTLTKGLSEVAKIKPADPVDYLAEFLFRENPEGKMFDPSYTRKGEELLQQYEEVTRNFLEE